MIREHDEYMELAHQQEQALLRAAARLPPTIDMPLTPEPVLTNVYIAGASRDFRRVRAAARSLEYTGLVKLTVLWWTDAEEWYGRAGRLQRGEQATIANAALDGIAASDVLWMLFPKQTSYGAFVELGAALLHRRLTGSPRVVVTGQGCSDSVFTSLADVRDPSDLIGRYDITRFAAARRFAAEDSRAVVT